jgi:hypothetical protein
VAASDNFARLKEQVTEADRTISAAIVEDEAAIEAKLDEARKGAETRAAELRAKTQEASDQAEDHWHKIQNDWDEHIQRSRQRLDETKAQLDATVALQDAEWAESDAMDAIDFASAAISEAEYAVLDALRARQTAQTLARSSA